MCRLIVRLMQQVRVASTVSDILHCLQLHCDSLAVPVQISANCSKRVYTVLTVVTCTLKYASNEVAVNCRDYSAGECTEQETRTERSEESGLT